jgi:hypothetical protein
VELCGFHLFEYRDVLGMPDEDALPANEAILEHLQKRHLAERVKSARGGQDDISAIPQLTAR